MGYGIINYKVVGAAKVWISRPEWLLQSWLCCSISRVKNWVHHPGNGFAGRLKFAGRGRKAF